MLYSRLYSRKELEEFLLATDRNLEQRVRLELIGMGSAILQFGLPVTTEDLDFVAGITPPVLEAFARAYQETHLNVEVEFVSVQELPVNYESRLSLIDIPGLNNIQLWVPDKYDLTLSKIARWIDKDVEDIKQLQDAVMLDKNVLMNRFVEEMDNAIGNRTWLAYNFIDAIETLFGIKESKRARRKIERHRKWIGVLSQ